MTTEDKQKIYNLLRTASRNIYGYTKDTFSNENFVEKVPEVSETITENNFPQTPDPVLPVKTKTQDPASDSNMKPVIQNQEAVNTQEQKQTVSETKSDSKPATSSGMTLGDVILKIARCTRCSLARTRANVVPGQGVKVPEVLVIGSGPDSEENASGISFSGQTGAFMDKMLQAIKLNRASNCYMTNIVKCAPPQNRNPYPEELEACSGYIEAQIQILKPKMILCAGRTAAVNLLKNDPNINISLPIDQLRGKWFSYNNIPVFVIHHPSEVLRNQNLKKPVWDDLRVFAQKLKELSPAYNALFNQ